MKKTILVGLGALAMAIAAIACIGRTNDATETFAEYSQGDVISAGKARVWIGYDTANPFYSYATELKIWTHKNQGNGDAGEHVYSSTDSSIYGTFNNSAESNRRYDYFDISESDYSNGWYLTVQKFQKGHLRRKPTQYNWRPRTRFRFILFGATGRGTKPKGLLALVPSIPLMLA